VIVYPEIPTADCPKHRLEKGCSSGQASPRDEYDVIGAGDVICCSLDGSEATRFGSDSECLNGRADERTAPLMTFFEAVERCENLGMRLCASLEGLNQACGTGCSYDNTLIWTAPSENGATARASATSAASVGDSISIAVRDSGFTASVACCSGDRGRWPEGEGPSGKWTDEVACAAPGAGSDDAGVQYPANSPEWAESACLIDVTFAEARRGCAALGERLCFAGEFPACHSGGCGHWSEDRLMWIEPQ